MFGNTSGLAGMDTPESKAIEKLEVRILPSGRSIQVRLVEGNEELEILSPAGQTEVRITLTENGPAVSVRCAALRLESVDSVSIDCRRFEVRTAEDVRITGRSMQVRTAGNIDLDGERINLNCEGDSNESGEPGR